MQRYSHITRAHIQSIPFCVLRFWGPDSYTTSNEKVPYILYIHDVPFYFSMIPLVLYSVKIADFGLSKAVGPGCSEARSTVGTAPYAAPEVMRDDDKSHDFASDLWFDQSNRSITGSLHMYIFTYSDILVLCYVWDSVCVMCGIQSCYTGISRAILGLMIGHVNERSRSCKPLMPQPLCLDYASNCMPMHGLAYAIDCPAICLGMCLSMPMQIHRHANVLA